VTATRPTSAHHRVLLALLCGPLAVVALALPAGARAAAGAPQRAVTKVVRYGGWSTRVPRSWPVYRLTPGSHTCVRFNRHAVYLGTPGSAERCPAHAVGRTEAILVSPAMVTRGPHADAATPATAEAAALSGGAVAQVTRRAQHVVVTATWNHRPGLVRGALGARSVPAAARAYARREASALRGVGADVAHATTTAPPTTTTAPPTTTTATTTTPTTTTTSGTTFTPPTTASSPGSVFTGLGFDACSTPSPTTMSDWSASPFRAIGVYIGGTNMACSQNNLTSTWATTEADAGWHLIPIYVGLQAPNNGCGCAAISSSTTTAASEGVAAAQSAVAEAQALGLDAGNPIYDDMENYTRTISASQAVLTFLQAWTTTLHSAGYLSGVYSSELSGIEDLVAEQGTGYTEPDDIWVANWNGQASTADAALPSTDWADNQRLHQYRGGHTDDYGGASISIDSDYLDAATASPGTGALTTTIAAAPSIGVDPQGDGTTDLAPSWSGQSGVAQWRILAGSSPTDLAEMITVAGSHHTVVTHNAEAYYQVQAFNSTGQELGSSGTMETRSHVAIFGHSAFVANHGPGGLPVECFGIGGCRVATTIRDAHKLLARTGYAKVAAGGGIDHFALSPAVHKLVAGAGNHGLAVTVTIRSSAGRSATRLIRLVRFTTSGAGPRRVTSESSSTALRILGGTDFVSHGWTGGILVACAQSTPCAATPSVSLRGHAIATARVQSIGAGEIGYLSFQMTAAGHRLLGRATGNQLGATVSVTTSGQGLNPGSKATALLALDSF
jgi:hypothetical protein